jgi:hypothetical protein
MDLGLTGSVERIPGDLEVDEGAVRPKGVNDLALLPDLKLRRVTHAAVAQLPVGRAEGLGFVERGAQQERDEKRGDHVWVEFSLRLRISESQRVR